MLTAALISAAAHAQPPSGAAEVVSAVNAPQTNIVTDAGADATIGAAVSAPATTPPAPPVRVSATALLTTQCADAAAEPDARITACTALLRLRPAMADAYGHRGLARAAKEDLTGALADYNRALSLRVSPIDLMNRASVLMATRNYQAAIADTDKAAALDPTDPKMESSRCWKRAVAGVELDIARQACDRALALTPNDPNTYDSRGLVFLKWGMYTEAFADYDAAVKLVAGKDDRNEASFLFGRGLAQVKLGRNDLGEADLSAALAENRNISTIYALNGLTR
jgi:tetratricopeptide (TPR) repeat protein